MEWNFDLAMLKFQQPLILLYGLKIFAALLIFIVGKWQAKKITSVLARVLERRKTGITLFYFPSRMFIYSSRQSNIFKVNNQLFS